MVALLRSLAVASQSSCARLSSTAVAPAALGRRLRTSAWHMNESSVPTHSEDAVHAEKTDADPKKLQEQTARKAQQQQSSEQRAALNDEPTHSEDSVHADRHAHDPLPDHKKSSKK